MAVNGVEIKVGQVWRMRNGESVKIEGRDPVSTYLWDVANGSYTINGKVFEHGSSERDLVELLIPKAIIFPKIDAHSDASESLVKKLAEHSLHAAVGDDHKSLTFHRLPEPGSATNPKDAIGSTKLPLHLWPAEATALGCLGMLEGKEKYGRNNFIAGKGVVASIYIDAAKRHIDAWFSGEEVSPDTQNDHLGNALACLAIIVKTRAHGKLIDDRDFAPNPGYRKLVEELTPNVKRLQELFTDKSPRHFTIADEK